MYMLTSSCHISMHPFALNSMCLVTYRYMLFLISNFDLCGYAVGISEWAKRSSLCQLTFIVSRVCVCACVNNNASVML